MRHKGMVGTVVYWEANALIGVAALQLQLVVAT